MDFLRLIGVIASLSSLSGCGMLGVREIDAWGFNMKFSEGLDYSVGFNQIDNVENKRGVRSSYDKDSALGVTSLEDRRGKYGRN